MASQAHVGHAHNSPWSKYMFSPLEELLVLEEDDRPEDQSEEDELTEHLSLPPWVDR